VTLVTTEWLDKNLFEDDVKILDCSWHMPNTKRIGKNDFLIEHIPNANFFNIDVFSDPESEYPHTIPKVNYFEELCGNLGLRNNDHIIVYDSLGIFSSPRVWWMFNYFGHSKISILDGGLIKWKIENKELENGSGKKYPKSKFLCFKNSKLLKIKSDIKKNIEYKTFNLVDARSSGRFNGNEPEPRPDIKSGSIPNSLNLPWIECIDQNTKCFLSSETLKKKFENLKISSSSEVVFSCGSGVTACILAKAFDIIGGKSFSIYDGSWTEWASNG